jgi:hypothetical protein
MSTTIKEIVILKDYKLVKPGGGGWYTVWETFNVTLSLPHGTTIVSARLKYSVHCDDTSTTWYGGKAYAGAGIYFSNQGNKDDMREIYRNWNMLPCNGDSAEQDVTPYIVPREGPDERTNYLQIMCGTWSTGDYCQFTFNVTLIVEYSGSEPSLTYQKTSSELYPQYATQTLGFLSALAFIISVLPYVIVLWLVLSIISSIRGLTERKG